ncbi:DUF6090 family protein [Polaribacter ponticola]|uniref:DUF6090 family protein n=1 Tax=Polaribacter ponticola TaxID=2978475 RepID=A0ABT5S8L1_9FLAO|nr:DUF6090 family protein [Polaribacter sp. MSW5]MDD7914437.1 DUF6090 family protein [Polaribacter sp. MSW5]
MIHLFRKTRQLLITDKRFKKYLLYAAGEVFLVVVGILLALQFNNWNIEKENAKKEEWYLTNIIEDIEYQKVILKDMQRHSLESIEVGKSIIKDFNEYKSFSKIDSLNEKLNFLIEIYNFPNTNNTYSELVSSGQLNLITNKALSIDIINYYLASQGSYDDVRNNIDNIFYPEVYPTIKNLCQITMYDEDVGEGEKYLLENYEGLNSFINNKLKSFETKLNLLNAIKIRIQILSVHLYMIKDTLEIGEELIKSIDEDLG